MQYAILRRILAVLIGFGLAATGLGASPAGEEEPAAAMDKEMVMDPATGKMVTAPEYGGTLTVSYVLIGETADPFITGAYAGFLIDGVNERLAVGDWGLDRKEFGFDGPYVPLFTYTGELAESWETPDPLTYVFHIRQGVHWHNKAPVNGRELTADDVVYTYQRITAQGDFTERPVRTTAAVDLPWESIEDTDEYTVVMKWWSPPSVR